MSGTYLPGDTRQRIQDLIKDSSITQAELLSKGQDSLDTEMNRATTGHSSFPYSVCFIKV